MWPPDSHWNCLQSFGLDLELQPRELNSLCAAAVTCPSESGHLLIVIPSSTSKQHRPTSRTKFTSSCLCKMENPSHVRHYSGFYAKIDVLEVTGSKMYSCCCVFYNHMQPGIIHELTGMSWLI